MIVSVDCEESSWIHQRIDQQKQPDLYRSQMFTGLMQFLEEKDTGKFVIQHREQKECFVSICLAYTIIYGDNGQDVSVCIDISIQIFSRSVPFVYVTVGSGRPKSSEPQRRIEPQSLTFWASIITTRPPRQLSTMTFTPSGECVPSHFDQKISQ